MQRLLREFVARYSVSWVLKGESGIPPQDPLSEEREKLKGSSFEDISRPEK